MRLTLIAMTAAFAMPALAQTPTTLQAVTTRGIAMKAYGMEFPIAYAPDGRFSATVGRQRRLWDLADRRRAALHPRRA